MTPWVDHKENELWKNQGGLQVNHTVKMSAPRERWTSNMSAL